MEKNATEQPEAGVTDTDTVLFSGASHRTVSSV